MFPANAGLLAVYQNMSRCGLGGVFLGKLGQPKSLRTPTVLRGEVEVRVFKVCEAVWTVTV